MIIKAVIVAAIPVAVIAGLYFTQRPKGRVIAIEPNWRNAEIIGDGAAPWKDHARFNQPRVSLAREIEPRGM